MIKQKEKHAFRPHIAGGVCGWQKPLIIVLIVLFGLGLFALGFWTSTHYLSSMEGPATSDNMYYNAALITPEAKLAELSDEGFTRRLFNEFTAMDAGLKKPGTQVHMVFWSGAGNHGNALNLVDTINYYVSKEGSVNKCIWAAGVNSSLQNSSFIAMNREAWYERAYPVDGNTAVFGTVRPDVAPVTPEQADAIWGLYSRRYAGQAALFKEATGKSVEVWCYVLGAKAKRIFYMNEFPELERLEAEGSLNVHFAKSADADWTEPSDWTEGTVNHPPALQ